MKTLNKNFRLTKSELSFLNDLDNNKPNLPETTLNQKERDQIRDLYHKYITKHIDNIYWNADLDESERREKWPSGQRVKIHEAQRMILSHLQSVNRWGNLTDKQAADKFLRFLKGMRKSFLTVIYYAYQK